MGLPKGKTNNPKGRPKTTVADQIRNDPRVVKVWGKVFNIALTLGNKNEHKDASFCTKIICDKTVPTLKAQEIQMDDDTLKAMGVIVLPAKKQVGSDVSIKNTHQDDDFPINKKQ